MELEDEIEPEPNVNTDYDLNSLDKNTVLLTGFNDCIIGTVTLKTNIQVVAYSVDLIIDKLRLSIGMTEDEAMGYYLYNISNRVVNDYNPIFIK